MNYVLFIIFSSAMLATCSNLVAKEVGDRTDQIIEYPVQNNIYAVVVVLDGVSAAKARKMARKRAAEVTVANGYRYFQVETEKDTQVIKGKGPGFGGNMYEEQIALKNFGREQTSRESANSKMYSAIRLTFSMHKEKPRSKSIDACTITPCDQ